MNRSSKVVIIFLLLFTAWIFLAPRLAETLIVEKPLARSDAILVLGGSAVYLERTQKAAEIYRSGISSRILLTDDGGRAGWSRAEQKNPKFVELARKSLIEQGVPAEVIEILQPEVAGTIDEARRLEEISRERNYRSVLLVTSAYHSRRALRTFDKALAESNLQIGLKYVPPGLQTPPPHYWWLSPAGWNLVAGEYVKTAYYWLYY
jgi:uncharacterized SAM-binding protein YcdF (DUF218 family)